MKLKTIALCTFVAFGTASAMSVMAFDEEVGVYVKDSVITTKVKAKLAEKHMSTLTKIKVDTDANGVVWLSGTAPSNDARDLAVQLAKDTDGVRSVHNKIVIAE